MVEIPAKAKFNIRQKSVTLHKADEPSHAIVTFEVFAYTPGTSGPSLPIAVFEQIVNRYEKSPEDRNPDYDRMVAEAAAILKESFARVVGALEGMCVSRH